MIFSYSLKQWQLRRSNHIYFFFTIFSCFYFIFFPMTDSLHTSQRCDMILWFSCGTLSSEKNNLDRGSNDLRVGRPGSTALTRRLGTSCIKVKCWHTISHHIQTLFEISDIGIPKYFSRRRDFAESVIPGIRTMCELYIAFIAQKPLMFVHWPHAMRFIVRLYRKYAGKVESQLRRWAVKKETWF